VTLGSEAAARLAKSQTKKKQWFACKRSGWYLGDFHHEDMTEDMSEDLPVPKRINVMVGITRSKVISHFFWCLLGSEPNISTCSFGPLTTLKEQ
jgi:hypothetical protein